MNRNYAFTDYINKSAENFHMSYAACKQRKGKDCTRLNLPLLKSRWRILTAPLRQYPLNSDKNNNIERKKYKDIPLSNPEPTAMCL